MWGGNKKKETGNYIVKVVSHYIVFCTISFGGKETHSQDTNGDYSTAWCLHYHCQYNCRYNEKTNKLILISYFSPILTSIHQTHKH